MINRVNATSELIEINSVLKNMRKERQTDAENFKAMLERSKRILALSCF